MTIELNTPRRPQRRERQDLSASRIDRQLTDLRNRLHVVTVALLDRVCVHFHVLVKEGASAEEKRQAIEQYFVHPEKLRYRGKILALLNGSDAVASETHARYPHW